MKLYIKYMVSLRCKMIVKEELRKLGIKFVVLDLGMVEILEYVSPEQMELLRAGLLRAGLELLGDKN